MGAIFFGEQKFIHPSRTFVQRLWLCLALEFDWEPEEVVENWSDAVCRTSLSQRRVVLQGWTKVIWSEWRRRSERLGSRTAKRLTTCKEGVTVELTILREKTRVEVLGE